MASAISDISCCNFSAISYVSEKEEKEKKFRKIDSARSPFTPFLFTSNIKKKNKSGTLKALFSLGSHFTGENLMLKKFKNVHFLLEKQWTTALFSASPSGR